MNYEKQLLLLNYLRGDQEIFIKTNPIISAKFFEPKVRPAVTFIQRYFNEYKALPTPEQVKAETGIELYKLEEFTSQERKWAETEIEGFCKRKAMEHAIITGMDLIKEERYADVEKLIKDAITLSIQRNLGTDYFADPEQRLNALVNNQSMYPTKITKLDQHLGGGLNRKEMIVFAAPSGVGKSITMLNIGWNLMSQGLNGAYITLELSEEVVSKRLDSIATGRSQADVLNDISQVAVEVKRWKTDQNYGSLAIRRMPESSTNATHIRAYLKEYELVHGKAPDFLIVDYIDICASAQQGISVENMFIKDKYVTEELRAIANDFNLIMITASQLNRGAQEIDSLDDLNQGHIAGGISKINTTDNLVMIIQTAQMKARGEMTFKLVKTRSSGGVGSYFILKFSPVSLRLSNLEQDERTQTRSFENAIASFRENQKTTPKHNTIEDVFQV